MKIRTFIITAGALLALVVPVAAGAALTGAGSLQHTLPVRQVQANTDVSAQLKSLQAKNKALARANKALRAKNKALAADHGSLAAQIVALGNEIRSLQARLFPPPPPQPVDPHLDCQLSGNSCTDEELCTIWGYSCDLPPAATTTGEATEQSAGEETPAES
jgi:hypothetical protein